MMSVLSSVNFLFYNLIYVVKPSEFPPKICIFEPPNFEKRLIKNSDGTGPIGVFGRTYGTGLIGSSESHMGPVP